MRRIPPIDNRSSPGISNNLDLSAALQRSLNIADTPTASSLRREADLRARDASLCLREAAILQREADQLYGEADALHRRERRLRDIQDAQFELNMYEGDGDEFWADLSASTPEDDALSSTASSITAAASTSNSHAPSQSTSTASSITLSASASSSHAPSQSTVTLTTESAQRVPAVTPPAVNRHAGDTREYEISSPNREGVVRSWSVSSLPHLFPQ